jgi:hypothetical protein
MRKLDDFLVDRVFEPISAIAGRRWGATSYDAAAAMAGISAWAAVPVVTGLAAALLSIHQFAAIMSPAYALMLTTALLEAHLAFCLSASRRASLRKAEALRRSPQDTPCAPAERLHFMPVRMAILAMFAFSLPIIVECLAGVPPARPFALSVSFQVATFLACEYFKACAPVRPERKRRQRSLASVLSIFLGPAPVRT